MKSRVPILLALVGLVVALLVVDRGRDTARATFDASRLNECEVDIDACADAPSFGGTGATDGGFGLPTAPAEGALSATWFCAGGTADEEAFADHTVIVANSTDASVSGTITFLAGRVRPGTNAASEGDALEAAAETSTTTEPDDDSPAEDPLPAPVASAIDVPPFSRIEIAARDLMTAPLAAAVVELPGSGLAVEHRVTSVHGTASAPCASDASSTWFFPAGATTPDARELLVFFNPFADDAVVDGTFSTDDGAREPARFDGLVIPARSVVGIDLGDDITLRSEIAAAFRTRSGRIVVDRLVRFDGSEGPRGLTLQLGQPRGAEVLLFPDGYIDEGISERFVLFNPSTTASVVEVEIVPDNVAVSGIPEPFEVTVQAESHEVIDVGVDERVARGVGHSAIVRTLDGSRITAERVLVLGAPSARLGVSISAGSPVIAPTWLVVDGATNAAQDEWIYLLNTSNEFVATVTVTALANGQPLPVQKLQEFELAPSARRAIRLGNVIERDDLSLLVTASLPIVVERARYAAEGPGVSNAIAIPFVDGLEFPAPFITDDG